MEPRQKRQKIGFPVQPPVSEIKVFSSSFSSVLEGPDEIKKFLLPQKAIKSSKDLAKLKKDIRSSLKKKGHKCKECPASFVRKSHLEIHVRTVHRKLKEFRCEECPASFGQKSSLKIHVRTVHSHPDYRPYSCKKCKKGFKTKSSLTKHVRTVHSSDRPFRCTECKQGFKTKAHLQAHTLCVHSSERPFQCTECNKGFKFKNNLAQHVRTVHSSERPLQCTKCNKGFKLRGDLNRHVRTIHLGLKQYVCSFDKCGKRFGTLQALNTHLRVHSKKKPFSCSICQKKFSQQSNLTKHMLWHAGEKRFNCTICQKKFSQKVHLTIHLRTHTGSKPFKCQECTKAFSTSTNLKSHEKYHIAQKSYKYPCYMQDFSTEKYTEGSKGQIPCSTRCKDERMLDRHIQCCHTAEGIAKRFKTEQQMAVWLEKQGIPHDRQVFIRHCGMTPKAPGVRSFPDFHLLDFQAKYNVVVLLGNDEFAHRRYECDLSRTLNIHSSIAKAHDGCRVVYIRFNPHCYFKHKTLYDPSLEERFRRLGALLQALENTLELEKGESSSQKQPQQTIALKKEGLSLIYMFYDKEEDGSLSVMEGIGDKYDPLAGCLKDCVVEFGGKI